MKISLVSRSGRDILAGGLDIPDDATKVDQLKALIHKLSEEKKIKGALLTPGRQRLTIPGADAKAKPVVLADGKTLADFDIKDGTVITLKDLGPQIGYHTVFFWEYFGPMVIYPLFYCFRAEIYGKTFEPVLAQRLAMFYHTFHYAKRIAETFFVHDFSHATMPIMNLFRNSGYYWMFGAMMSYFINHPDYTSPNETLVKAAILIALMMQAGNFTSHIILTNLRKSGKGYLIPRGFAFNFVTCANYTFEIYGWFFFNVATQSVMGVLFMCAGALQMIQWALAKHKRLRTLFDGKDGKEKYPRRWVILPPFI